MPIDDHFNKEQYDLHATEYLETNADQHVGGGDAKHRVALIRSYLQPGSNVLEIGAGGGDDALALQQAGYEVVASDFSEKFVDILRTKNLDALLLDAKTDEIPESFHAVYANAVFVHFTPAELSSFLRKAFERLQDPKLIFLSVIQGESQERCKGKEVAFDRDFQDYSEEMLQTILAENGFKIQHQEVVDERWIQVVAIQAESTE